MWEGRSARPGGVLLYFVHPYYVGVLHAREGRSSRPAVVLLGRAWPVFTTLCIYATRRRMQFVGYLFSHTSRWVSAYLSQNRSLFSAQVEGVAHRDRTVTAP